MFSGNWIGKKSRWSRREQPQQRLTKGQRRKTANRQQCRSLRIEELEDRRLLAVYSVDNLLDIGPDINGDEVVIPGSLRQAINLSNASEDEVDTIVFEDFLFTDPITGLSNAGFILLSNDEALGGSLILTDEVSILGPGSGTLTVSAGGAFRVFETNIDADDEVRPVTIGGLTITGGALVGNDEDANRGAGIFNREALTLIETVITGNSASQGGGGIFLPFGSLNLVRSVVGSNTGGGGGGGILMFGNGDDMRPSVTISNSTIYNNSTFGQPDRPGFGGGVFNRDGFLTIQNSTITQNSSTAGGSGVATYGVGDPEEDPAIVTQLSHSILYGNAGDDVMAVRSDIEGAPLAPTLNLNSNGGYNFIGQIGNASLRGNPNDLEDEDNPAPLDSRRFNFYEVVSAPDGISWTDANLFGDFGPGNSSFLASISGNVPDPEQVPYDPVEEFLAENEFIFGLIDQDQFWIEFTPTEPNEAEPPPQNIGPWIGGIQVDKSGAAGDGWQWVNFVPGANPPPPFPIDPFDLINAPWAAGQPDDGLLIAEPDDPVDEDRIAFFDPESPARSATWGDLPAEPDDEQEPIAYVLEYEQGNNFFGLNPLLSGFTSDVGGSTRVFYPGIGSPAIDAGDPGIPPSNFSFEQRGRHFRRVADGGTGNGPIIDIGAVEVQQGRFRVDTLADEADGQYSGVWQETEIFGFPFFEFPGYDTGGSQGGDFSLREAIEFSEKNPEVDTITFEAIYDPQILLDLDDPLFSTLPPTILLRLTSPSDPNSALTITQTVNIIGPTGFEIEIDASGNDPTPGSNDADGTRIFNISDNSLFSTIDVTLANLTLQGGDAVNAGGAILNSENLTITGSTIKENAASTNGGGVFSQFGNLVIESTTLSNNDAAKGGGLFVDTGLPGTPTTAVVRNSTLSGNLSGSFGGGLYNYNGEVLVEFSTITLNSAGSFQTSGIGSANGVGDTLTQIRSSIVSANLGGDIDFIFGSTTVQSLGFNLIGTGTAALVFNQPGDMTGVTDPMLSPLQNTGGRNPTHRLLPGSPAIDTGDSVAVAGVAGVPEFDARGSLFTRVFDGVQDTKDRIDIGAYELQPTVFIVDTLLDENDGDTSAGRFSLREAIEAANANPLTDTIMFSPSLLGGEIQQSAKNGFSLQPFTPTDIRITDSVNIIGLGQSFLTLSGGAVTDFNILGGGGISRFFTIDDSNAANDIEVKITDLRLRQSRFVTDVGASILSRESLTLERVTFVDNSTQGAGFSGGAIYQRYGDLTLDRVTLTANTTDGVDADGGAVYVRDADLTVMNNTTISGNTTTQAFGSGGGIYIRDGVLTMSNSTVTGNLAPGGEADGAGIYGNQAVLNITDSIISFNSMTGSNSQGAGIHAKDSDLTLVDSVVGLNSTVGTQSAGAGIYLNGGTATIEGATISSNTTIGNFASGAGIAVVGTSLDISRSTLAANTTSGQNASGGAIYNLGGDVTIVDSLITGSSVSGIGSQGGGVYSSTNLTGSSTTTLLNSTISGNSSAVAGGGFYNRGGLSVIRHSTITDNSGPTLGFGSGVGSFGNLATTRTDVYSSIIAGNGISDVDRVNGAFANTFRSLGYNLIGTGLSISEFTEAGDLNGVVDPMLNPLQFNGGPTLVHSLIEGGPAVNGGDPNAVAGSNGVPDFDQRGPGFAVRVLGGTIDIGAFESTFAPAIPTDFDGDGDTDGNDFLAWQRGFGTANASKADGDSNDDNIVDGVDLANWMADFGTGTAAAAEAAVSAAMGAASTGVAASSYQDTLVAPLEPLLGEPVLVASLVSRPEENLEIQAGADSQLLAGLTLTTVAASIDSTSPTIVVETDVEPNIVQERDLLFADFATFAALGNYEDIASELSETEEEEALEFAFEDQVFALLGN